MNAKIIFLTLTLVMLIPSITECRVDEKEMRKKCAVTVKWAKRGEDATVTLTIKNATKKTMTDPVVRVRFYDAEGAEVTTDAKAYFAKLKPGTSKRMETRIWSSISPLAESAKGEVEYCVFE